MCIYGECALVKSRQSEGLPIEKKKSTPSEKISNGVGKNKVLLARSPIDSHGLHVLSMAWGGGGGVGLSTCSIVRSK